MMKKSNAWMAVFAAVMFAAGAANAAENAGWGGGTGFWSDTNWYPASAPATASAWTSGNYAVFTNGTEHTLDLAGGTFTAASLRTPTGTTAARTEVVVSNGTLVLDNAINGTGSLDGNFMKSAIFTFGEGCTVRNDTAKWGLGLNNDSHIVFGPGSTYNETYSAKYNEVEAQGSNFIGANNAYSNSVTICEGANVNLKRRLVIGGVLGPKQGGNANTIGVMHIKGGNLKITDDAYLIMGRNVSGWAAHNNNGKSYYIQDGGNVSASWLCMGSVWGKSYGSYGAKGYFTLNSGSFKVDYTHIGYQNEMVITVNGGTFDAGYFRIGATENTSAGTATSNNQCYMTNNKLYLNGGVMKLRYLNMNDAKGSTTGGVWCNGGTLKPTASFNTSSGDGTKNFIINAGGLTVDTDSGITFGLYQQVKGGAGAITKTGAGTMVLAWTPLNTGGFIVNGGVLNVGGTSTGTVKITGPLVVNNGGTIYMNENAANRSPCSGLMTLNAGAKVKVPVTAQGEIAKTPAGQSGVAVNGAVSFVFNVKPVPGIHAVLESASASVPFEDEDVALFSAPDVPEAVFSLSADKMKVLMTVPPPEGGYVWIGGTDGLMSTAANWMGGIVPSGSGAKVHFRTGGAITNDLQDFAPASLTFAASIGERAVLDGNAITGVSAITNNTSTHHVFNCQVVCPDGVTPNITRTDAAYMRFAGGLSMHNAPKTGGGVSDFWSGNVTLRTTDKLRFDSDNQNYLWIVNGGTFSVKTACVDRAFVDSGAKIVADCLEYTGCPRYATANKQTGWFATVFDNGNGVIRVGEIRAQSDAVLFHSFAGSDMTGGTIIADKLTCAQNKQTGGAFPYPIFMLNCGAVSGAGLNGGDWNGEGVWAIGPGGLSFAESVHSRTHYELKLGKSIGGRPAATLHSFADWTLHSNPNGECAIALQSDNGTFLVIDTSHYTIGEPKYDSATCHDVTLTGTIAGGGAMRVVGNGRVIFNSASSFTGGLTVSNAATVAVNAGYKPGSGAVLVTSGATLSLPESGVVTIPGTVTLQEDSMLEFHVDGTDSALLTLSSAPALPESGKVTVKLTADSLPKVGSSYTLTSGAGLADTSKFELADGVQGDLLVQNGELVYTTPDYFYIRVADNGRFSLKDESDNVINVDIPVSWIYAKTDESDSSSPSAIATALADPGENGIPAWQSYCLGLEPNEASSVVLCEAAETQPAGGQVTIAAKNLNVPEGLSGVAVTARLERKSSGDWEQQGESKTVKHGDSIAFTVDADPVADLSFFA